MLFFQSRMGRSPLDGLRGAVSFLLAVGLLLFLSPLHAEMRSTVDTNPTWSLARSNPAKLMQLASQHELANSYGRRPPVRYRLRKITAKSDTTKDIVETSDGGVARLIAIEGHPLSAARTQQEVERLQTLDGDPSIEAHRRSGETRDAARIANIMRLLPVAFLYQFDGSAETADGPLIRLKFRPNPKFSPPNFESRVLTGIRGEAWIDPNDFRVVHIRGRIFKTVDYGWGILGSISPGSTMLIEQSKTPACGWQMAHLSLHLNGKELMFKTLHIALDETASDYQFVSHNWNYKDAVRWLLQMPVVPTD